MEQKAEDVPLVSAQRDFFIEVDGVLGFVLGRKLAVADEEIDGVESVGEELPALEWGHLLFPFGEIQVVIKALVISRDLQNNPYKFIS